MEYRLDNVGGDITRRCAAKRRENELVRVCVCVRGTAVICIVPVPWAHISSYMGIFPPSGSCRERAQWGLTLKQRAICPLSRSLALSTQRPFILLPLYCGRYSLPSFLSLSVSPLPSSWHLRACSCSSLSFFIRSVFPPRSVYCPASCTAS